MSIFKCRCLARYTLNAATLLVAAFVGHIAQADATAPALSEAPSFDAPNDDRASGFPFTLPLLDAPYDFSPNTDGGSDGKFDAQWPSMATSLSLSTSAYSAIHYGLNQVVDPNVGGWKGFGHRMAFLGVDALMTYLPLGDGWLHEEFHRAVMGRRGIGSHDGVYDFNIGASTISVDHVADADLVRLKKDHPAEQVHLTEAGIEGQNLLTHELQKTAFFDDADAAHPAYHQFLYWYNYINLYEYVRSGATKAADKLTDDFNARESNIPVRDFAGHDFTAWVYDLFRPDEPYATRGVHPSGNGIDRYRSYADLSAGEAAYLAWMGRLTLLNFVDGALLRNSYRWGDGTFVNGSLKHYLTPFGFAVDANWLEKVAAANVALTLHNYRNRGLSLFGADASLVRFNNLGILQPWLTAVTLRAAYWRQPARQRFDDWSSRPGGLASATFYLPLYRRLETYVELERKAPGWVAGIVDLDQATSIRLGIAGRLF